MYLLPWCCQVRHLYFVYIKMYVSSSFFSLDVFVLFAFLFSLKRFCNYFLVVQVYVGTVSHLREVCLLAFVLVEKLSLIFLTMEF